MFKEIENGINKSRRILQNPYAHLDGEGSFSAEEVSRPRDVHDARRILQNQYAYLDEFGSYSEWNGAVPVKYRTKITLASIAKNDKNHDSYSRQDIEKTVRSLQKALWSRRGEIFPDRRTVGPLEMLDPSIALDCLGYSVHQKESLGQYSGVGELFEVAGILDKDQHDVLISRRFSPEIRNFTMAHELGHAVLHEGTGLHRDRPLDGAAILRHLDSKEVEANIFAAVFLLPEKQVRSVFRRLFLTETFVLNEATSFALMSSDLSSVQNKCGTLRDLSRLLASAEYYNGKYFESIAKQFRVSIEAMAIRIEELKLVSM